MCCLIVSSAGAWAKPTDLSNGVVLYPPGPPAWAVYAYDPDTSSWMQLNNVNWQVVSTVAHSGYLIEATAPAATSASTYRVVMDVIGRSIEVFMTPTVTQRLAAGETTTLRINLF
jgi:hypothetical protein